MTGIYIKKTVLGNPQENSLSPKFLVYSIWKVQQLILTDFSEGMD